MQPTLISLNIFSLNWEISSYPFFMLIAILAAVFGTWVMAIKRGLPKRQTFFALLIMLFAALIGARLLHIIINHNLYQKRPDRIFAFDTQGFSLYGGILSASLAGFFAARFYKFSLWRIGDSAAPFLGLSIVLMRIGCFLNGCCFGKETNLPWGMAFPTLSPAHKYQLAQHIGSFFSVNKVHPTQLYELLAALLCSVIALYGLKKKWPEGVVIIIFGILFSFFRLFNYYLRVMPSTFDAPDMFYPIFYLVLIVIGTSALAMRLRFKIFRINESG